jgi:hypothetical protein
MTTLTGAQKTQFIDQGYVQVPGLLPPAQVAATRNALCASLGIAEGDPATWEGKPGFPDDAAVLATTIAARTEDFESVAEQLVGPDFLRGICYSPFLEWRGKTPVMAQGYIPVLTYPTSGAPEFVMPSRDSFHIDGGESIRAWPGVNFLAVMVYLTDVAEPRCFTPAAIGRSSPTGWPQTVRVRRSHPRWSTPPLSRSRRRRVMRSSCTTSWSIPAPRIGIRISVSG